MKKIIVLLLCFSLFSCDEDDVEVKAEKIKEESQPVKNIPKNLSEESLPQKESMPFDIFDVVIESPEDGLRELSSFQATVHSFSKGGIFGETYSDNENTSYTMSYIFFGDHILNRIDYKPDFFPDKRGRFVVTDGTKVISYFSDSMVIENIVNLEPVGEAKLEFAKSLIPLCSGLVSSSIINKLCEYVGESNVIRDEDQLSINAIALADDSVIPESFKKIQLNIKEYVLKYNNSIYDGSELVLSNQDKVEFRIKDSPIYENKTGLKVKVGKISTIQFCFDESLGSAQVVEGVDLSDLKDQLQDLNQELVIVEYYKNIRLNLINPVYFRPADFGITM